MAELTLTGFGVLREVAARGSFTAAAESLGYTQSAVSRQVGALEAAAGSPLFERAPRGVRLTDAGRALLRHANEVLDHVDDARRELAGLRDLAGGRVRVGAFPTALAALVPRAVSAFADAHPAVEVDLREGTTPTLLRRLAGGTADLVVVSDPPVDQRHRFALEPLLDCPVLLAVARDHPLAARRSVDPEELCEAPWVVGSTDRREALLGAWDASEWQPRVAYVARDWTSKLGLVAEGLGVTLVPGLAALALRDDVALVRLRGSGPATRRVLVATRQGVEPPAPVRAFVEQLHDVAAAFAVELRERVGA